MNSSFKILAIACAAAIELSAVAALAGPATTPASAPVRGPATSTNPALVTKAAASAPAESVVMQDVRQSMRNLWLESVQAPSGQDPAGELVVAIKQLDAMNVARKVEPVKEPVVIAASQPATTSAPAVAAAVSQELTGAVLDKLKALGVDDLEDPAAVADQLYEAAQPSAAAILYELALKKNSPGMDKAWLLLQIGNCKAKTDQAAALTAYRQVVAEFSSSCWAAVATSKIRLIEWYQANGPQARVNAPSGK